MKKTQIKASHPHCTLNMFLLSRCDVLGRVLIKIVTSALPLIATEGRTWIDVGFVPGADSCTATNSPHSMSWSARRRKDSEIVSPRVLAVFKLMTSANLVGCWTGRSEDLAPFKILST